MWMNPSIRAPGRRLGAPLLGLALLALTASMPRAATLDDAGTYRVYQKDRLLGTEDFWMHTGHDSLLVRSSLRELLPRPGGIPDSLSKVAQLVLAAGDGNLVGYVSQEYVNGSPLRRELVMYDTTYTSYRQRGLGGYSDVFVRPPGRLYVVDPQVFALFDLLFRHMHEQSFDERPVTMVYLAGRDTSVEATVKRLGADSVRVGKRSLAAEKFSFTDPWAEFFAWVSPTGRMLKLTQPVVGLRVERDIKTLTASGQPASSRFDLPPPGPRKLR